VQVIGKDKEMFSNLIKLAVWGVLVLGAMVAAAFLVTMFANAFDMPAIGTSPVIDFLVGLTG